MTNALAADPPGIGHNLPPLAEQLAEEIAALRLRADALIATAGTAVIIDQESAEKVINLGQMIAALEKELDVLRVERGKPFLEATRTINTAFGAITGPLAQARSRLRPMLTEYQRRVEAEAEQQRQAALAEQRQREEEAAAAAERAQQSTTVDDALDALHAREEADAAQRRADAIRPEPVRAQLGSLGTRREIVFTVSSYPKALGWLLRVRKRETEMALEDIINKQLRSMGVDAVEAEVTIPGVEASIEKSAAIRR